MSSSPLLSTVPPEYGGIADIRLAVGGSPIARREEA
jgi:hypothetical protein